MASRRSLKAAEAIREVVATSILTDLKDPRVEGATITRAEVSADMRLAKVYFTTLGGETKERLVLQGLSSAAGFLQQKCAKRIDTRYTPTLTFAVDEGVKNLIAVTEILAAERAARESAEATADEEQAVDDEDEADDAKQGDASPEDAE